MKRKQKERQMEEILSKKNDLDRKVLREETATVNGIQIPIIAMTANTFAEDVQKSLDAGMNAHLSKPIVIDEVVRTISRYIA